MSTESKKILSIITYYTLFTIAIIMAILTIVFMLNRVVPTWAKIVYIIWACAVIINLLFDVYCTTIKRMKFYSGICVYILSVASIVVTAIVYATSASLTAGLTTVFMPVFTALAATVLSTSIYLIATFIVGEAVSEHKSALRSMQDK